MTSFILESTLQALALAWVPSHAVMSAAVLDESVIVGIIVLAVLGGIALAKHLSQILQTVRRDAPETPLAASTEIEHRAS